MGYIFLSYSRKDRQIMDTLARKLQDAGFEIWLDTKGIRGGKAWRKEIVIAIEGAAALVVALSPHSAASSNVATELDLAKDANKAIIPLEIRTTAIPPEMKYQLTGLQRILLEPFEDGFAELVRSLAPFQIESAASTGGAGTTTKVSEKPRLTKPTAKRRKKVADKPAASASESKEVSSRKSGGLTRALIFERLANVIQQEMSGTKEDRVYLVTNIPKEKLISAMNAYASDASPADCLLLYDNTVFGGAKEGLLLTTTKVYWKNLVGPPHQVAYSDIQSITSQRGSFLEASKLSLNDEVFQLAIGDTDALAKALMNAIRAITTFYRETKP